MIYGCFLAPGWFMVLDPTGKDYLGSSYALVQSTCMSCIPSMYSSTVWTSLAYAWCI